MVLLVWIQQALGVRTSSLILNAGRDEAEAGARSIAIEQRGGVKSEGAIATCYEKTDVGVLLLQSSCWSWRCCCCCLLLVVVQSSQLHKKQVAARVADGCERCLPRKRGVCVCLHPLRLARRLAEQLRLLERGHTCRRRSTRQGQYEAT